MRQDRTENIPMPALTVDGVIIKDGSLLLVRRGKDPYLGSYALPGGFVEFGERVEEAVVREVMEETGLETRVTGLLGVFLDPDRDPRGHTVSVVFLLTIVGGVIRAGDDAADATLFPFQEIPPLAFDHEAIISELGLGKRC